ncbi:hypothetical protein ACP4OV_007266 [Aristida adscensionis]
MPSPKIGHHLHRGAAAKHHHPQARAAARQRPPALRRAMLHSCACFLLGLAGGLAPSAWTDAASRAAATANAAATAHVARAINQTTALLLLPQQHTAVWPPARSPPPRAPPPRPPVELVVVVTATGQSERERRAAGLTRTAHALRLVAPPVVWLVVEAAREAAPTARLLRRTAVAYRHVTYKENFSTGAAEEELHHQRNAALGHIEQHRLRGVVLFAGLADVYDLRLLHQLRRIRTFGAWPVATVWEQEQRVAVEGPVCSSSSASEVTGWFSLPTAAAAGDSSSVRPRPPLPEVGTHGFAFISDLLWDPARWDRFPTSEPDQSEDSIKFVQRLMVADYNKTRGMPDYSNCSEIMAWRVDTTLLL